MNFYTRRNWAVIRDYCIGWTLSLLLFILVHRVGTIETGPVQYTLEEALINIAFLGPILGVISAITQLYFEERIVHTIPFKKLIFLRLIVSVVFFIIVILTTYFFSVIILKFQDLTLWEFIKWTNHIPAFIYMVLTDFGMALIRQVNQMLGYGKLQKYLKGDFYEPQQEFRIFMFLDLQSSTTIAEKLGHIRYSRLLQDCFSDLNVVIAYQTEIYQYVGDEVVLTWDLKGGINRTNCFEAFFKFKERLASRSDYYQRNYDTIPFFKAGMNAGNITVAEIGKFKREIAYHGDTINTAARIQEKCNVFNRDLLISEDLYTLIKSTKKYEFRELGDINLKGKKQQVPIFSVSKTE